VAPANRFSGLGLSEAAGVRVPVAERLVLRLLGLAFLPRERAGPGLLIPRCRSVHTFGMRFPLDLVFLDAAGREIRRCPAVPPGRVVSEAGAEAVLELPA
jgi:uncharacterized membrane protein (UPF0127 family)